MSFFAMSTVAAIDPQPADVVVTLTGISLVFLILVVLMCIITVEGKIFDSMAAKKEAAAQAAKQAAQDAPVAVQAATPAPTPVVEEGIPGAIVAAIAAAVACMSGGKYTLRAVRRAGKAQGNGWSKAGVSDVTSPF